MINQVPGGHAHNTQTDRQTDRQTGGDTIEKRKKQGKLGHVMIKSELLLKSSPLTEKIYIVVNPEYCVEL